MKLLGTKSLSSNLKLLLDIVWYAAAVGSAFVIGFMVVLAIDNPACPVNAKCVVAVDDVHFTMDNTSTQLRSDEGGTAYFSEGAGKLTIRGPLRVSTGITIVLGVVVFASLYLFAIWQLRQLFRTFVDGVPFAVANVKRLRLIGGSIICVKVFASLFSFFLTQQLDHQFSGEGIHLASKLDANLSTIFAAAVILILAEIFRLGAQLEEEKAHTV